MFAAKVDRESEVYDSLVIYDSTGGLGGFNSPRTLQERRVKYTRVTN